MDRFQEPPENSPSLREQRTERLQREAEDARFRIDVACQRIKGFADRAESQCDYWAVRDLVTIAEAIEAVCDTVGAPKFMGAFAA